MQTIQVEFMLREDQLERLERALPQWNAIPDKNGKRYFKDYTIGELFAAIMQVGSYHYIDEKLDFLEEQLKRERIRAESEGDTGGET